MYLWARNNLKKIGSVLIVIFISLAVLYLFMPDTNGYGGRLMLNALFPYVILLVVLNEFWVVRSGLFEQHVVLCGLYGWQRYIGRGRIRRLTRLTDADGVAVGGSVAVERGPSAYFLSDDIDDDVATLANELTLSAVTVNEGSWPIKKALCLRLLCVVALPALSILIVFAAAKRPLNASSLDLLLAAQLGFVLLSSGLANLFGHPFLSVLDRIPRGRRAAFKHPTVLEGGIKLALLLGGIILARLH